MRRTLLAGLLCSLLIAAQESNAQTLHGWTPSPTVNAAAAEWRLAGEPIFYSGSYYHRAGATVFFDGKVMVPSGVYDGVELFTDVTLEPYSVLYLPLGRGVMAPYERRRDGELAGTVGSRTPSFVVPLSVESPFVERVGSSIAIRAGAVHAESIFHPRRAHRSRRYSTRQGRASQQPSAPPAAARNADAFTAVGAVMISPSTATSSGTARTLGNADVQASTTSVVSVWVEFEQERWYSAGASVLYDASRFTRVGQLSGLPVYRARDSAGTRIYVTSVPNGALAPFDKR